MFCNMCGNNFPEDKFSPGMLSRRICRRCNGERNREYRHLHPEKVRQYDAKYLAKNKDKQRAKLVILDAIRYRGFLVQSCQVCGKEDGVHGHHPSYLPEDWLTVVWLCPVCHKGVHHNRIDISNLPTYTAPPIQGRWGEKIAS